MSKLQYHTEYHVYTLRTDYNLENELNRLAADGWRVIQCLPENPHFSNSINPAFLLERIKLGPLS